MGGLIVLVRPLARAPAFPIAVCGRSIAVSFASLSISMCHARAPEFLPCPVADRKDVFAFRGGRLCWNVTRPGGMQYEAGGLTAFVVVICKECERFPMQYE